MIIDTKPFREYQNRLKGTKKLIRDLSAAELNRITDRHLARCKKGTPVGISPDSPTLRDRWDRSGVQDTPDGVMTEVFNPTEYAAYWEFGHRQTPGRVVFIELSPGQSVYGRPAREVKKGKHAGKWGVTLRLKKSYVKGAFIMTDSEKQAQRELDAAAKRIFKQIERSLG